MRFLSGRNLDVLVFSVLCHTAEESGLYSCPLTPVPSSSELRGKRQIEASSDPFHVTSSLPILCYLFTPHFLSLLAGPDQLSYDLFVLPDSSIFLQRPAATCALHNSIPIRFVKPSVFSPSSLHASLRFSRKNYEVQGKEYSSKCLPFIYLLLKCFILINQSLQ